jgi:hypothetical protein
MYITSPNAPNAGRGIIAAAVVLLPHITQTETF